MNPVLIGFLFGIPIYFLILLIWNKVKKNKELKKEKEQISKAEVLELLKSPQFKELVYWIKEAKQKKYSDRAIKKALKKNDWDDITIIQAINQVKESEKYAKEKRTAKIPSGFNTKQRSKLAFRFKGEDEGDDTSTTERDNGNFEESRNTPSKEAGTIPRGNIPRSERHDFGNEGAEQSGILQLSPVSSSKPDKRKSKWDWRSIKQNR